jgi:hypothetical protein
MSTLDSPILESRCFSADLQEAFSALSGDRNPMHDDPIAARRTVAGGLVVHGIHQALSAIEAAVAHRNRSGYPLCEITEASGLFQRPVLVGETANIHLTEFDSNSCQIVVALRDQRVSKFSIRWGERPPSPQMDPPALREDTVNDLRFDELQGRSGGFELGLDRALAEKMFPLAISSLGPTGIAELLALSRLVGAHCPGLHSVFSKFTVAFNEPTKSTVLKYKVEQTDERFGAVSMRVNGPRISGMVHGHFRPPPEQQPLMAEVARLVAPGSYANSIALIVGGSRGLGEVTARVIAAGGGLPIITYYQGAKDAERIAADIHSSGARCEVLQYDIRLNGIPKLPAAPRSLYYFATPKIFRRRGFFDHELLRDFEEVYLSAFGHLIDNIAANGPTKLAVFYPSSIAVSEPMRELAEYSIAKRAGEEMCEFYNRHSESIRILIERLPRIRTDQTSTMLTVPAAEALTVMLPLVQRVEALREE